MCRKDRVFFWATVRQARRREQAPLDCRLAQHRLFQAGALPKDRQARRREHVPLDCRLAQHRLFQAGALPKDR